MGLCIQTSGIFPQKCDNVANMDHDCRERNRGHLTHVTSVSPLDTKTTPQRVRPTATRCTSTWGCETA